MMLDLFRKKKQPIYYPPTYNPPPQQESIPTHAVIWVQHNIRQDKTFDSEFFAIKFARKISKNPYVYHVQLLKL